MGAANIQDDGGYAGKVMAEHSRLRQVAAGRATAMTAPQPIPVAAPALKTEAPADEDKVALLAK